MPRWTQTEAQTGAKKIAETAITQPGTPSGSITASDPSSESE